jgi:hypothetical protein
MTDLLSNIRYALRVLWKSPAFTLVALLTLTLSIGANVVVFGVVNVVLLHPLDVSDPQNLYQLRFRPWTHGKLLTTSYPAFQDYRRRNTTFSEIAGYDGYSGGRLSWGNSEKIVSGYSVTGNYFEMLGGNQSWSIRWSRSVARWINTRHRSTRRRWRDLSPRVFSSVTSNGCEKYILSDEIFSSKNSTSYCGIVSHCRFQKLA